MNRNSASFGHFKSPLGWRFDLIIRARRLECGVYYSLTQHFSACGLSTKKALSLLFPDAIKLAAFKYSEQAAINAYEMEMHNIQMVI